MLRSTRDIVGYELIAKDGAIGRCKDFLFDDREWKIRHMVGDTTRWLPGRKVLIPPETLGNPDWDERRFPVKLTKSEIKDSPPLKDNEPVSRKYEKELFRHHGWAFYWTGAGPWSRRVGGTTDPAQKNPLQEEIRRAESRGPNLHSEREVIGYRVLAADRAVGKIVNFIVDDETWAIRYAVVDTGSWLHGRSVLVAPTWLTSTDWVSREVHTNLQSKDVEGSPPYDPSAPVNRAYETALYDYYGRPVDWRK